MEELNNLVPENFPLFLFNSKGSAKKKMQALGVGRQIIFICSGGKMGEENLRRKMKESDKCSTSAQH